MTIVALAPLRSLHDGKQRLRDVLSRAERTALIQRLFQRVQQALAASGQIAQIGVVSPDPALLEWAAALQNGLPLLPILQPDQGLNAGLEYGRRVLLQPGANGARPTGLLVVLPDLPAISAADIQALVRLSAPNSVVVAPDRHGQGTNALLARPPDALPFDFGGASLARHAAAARARGLELRRYEAPSIALDIDTADDLQLADALGAPFV
jgi:2-phospho-L-lactate guanylyltransferase